MPTTRFFNCLCSIGQIAMAAIILGQAPQSSLAFAPSLNFPATTTASTRHVSPASSFQDNRRSKAALHMSEENDSQKSSLPVFLDPGTKGGAVVLSILLFVTPLVGYQVAVGPFGMDEIEAGRNIGTGFTVFTMLLWGGSYIFRVATKDMTYAKQLKDYEDAVIAKRLEELDEDEVQALVEGIERDEF
eukprot:CAMPEP_0201878554 /NCGR_PEP_ID=MMETSP0902-20130614/9690_1 /ASSEMBLY_ACC=CAM_ASM_000551 /TAXON_ID=420261 /ORGANISM="Thalassiosira antarctica, Strain CCMP982" /LENGTH=187 /DNA_ID=CAMNT_0048406221 /DNA_START=64 /DNA_END=627 /DNA_ORIENTATION=+